MKHALLFSILAGALLFYSPQAAAKQNKIIICHKGHTITIAEPAAAAHLAHGDSEGECTEQQQADAKKEEREYQYRYFPSVQVYYDETRAMYFFQVEGAWQEAAELPASITVNQQEMVNVTLDVDLPYIEHETVLTHYPAPQTADGEFHYLYYPSAQVYYDEARALYFYQLDGQWQQAEQLPASISILATEAVSLTLTTATPYLEHERILVEYPVPPAESENAQKKVTICHKGKNTLSIAESALQAHLNHGDTEGACQAQQTQEKQQNSSQKTNGAKEKPQNSEKKEKGKGNKK